MDVSLDHTLGDLNALGLPLLKYVVGMSGGAWDQSGMLEGKIGGPLPTLCYKFPDTTSTGDDRYRGGSNDHNSSGGGGGWWEVSYVADQNATETQPVYIRYTRTDSSGRLAAWPTPAAGEGTGSSNGAAFHGERYFDS